MDKHKKLFKAKADISDIRNQRCNQAIELRQSRRDDIIHQKRMMPNKEEDNLNIGDISTNQILDKKNEQTLVIEALSDNYDERYIALKTIRTILSNRDYRPIDLLIKPDAQYEALWSLTNIASGESHQTRAVVNNNFLPLLYQTIQSSHLKVAEQSAWAISNIVGEGVDLRNIVIQMGFLDLLINIINNANNSSISLLQNITWLMINIVRSKDEPLPINYSIQSIDILKILMTKFQDFKIISDSLWGLSFLIDSSFNNADIVVKSNIASIAISFFNQNDSKIKLGIIRCLGNLAAGPDNHTDYVCKLNIISQLPILLEMEDIKIIQETLWLISNIVAGTREQMRTIILSPIVERVIYILSNGLYMHKKEALWVISNIIHNGETTDNLRLVELGVIDSIVGIFQSKDSNLVKHALESLLGLFKICSDCRGLLKDNFEMANGNEWLDKLMAHPKSDIVKLATEISSKFIETSESNEIYDQEIQNMNMYDENNFNF